MLAVGMMDVLFASRYVWGGTETIVVLDGISDI